MRSREVGFSTDAWDAPDRAERRASVEPLGPGTVLAGRYRILNVVGRGGFGTVLVAHDGSLQREVAIKVADDEGDVSRLEHEAAVTAHLDHPGIVAVHDVGRDASGRPWFAMRIVRGRALAAVLDGPRATSRDARVRVLLTAAEAVAHAHRRGVAHGDLSPANIMVGEHGEVQVIDWGLAERCDGSPPTRPGGAGTFRYMSPERRAGAPPDRAADVFALGVLLLTLDDDRRELRSIALRASDADPARRYPDAGALADDLQRFIDGLRVRAHTYRLADHLRRHWRARRGIVLTLAAAIAVVATVVVAGFVAVLAERDAAIAAGDDARRQLHDNLVARSVDAAVSDERADALMLAREALAIGPSPAALGVVAAFAQTDPPVLVAAVPLPTCRRVGTDPGGKGLWCDQGDAIAWWDDARDALERPPLRSQGSAREVVMLRAHVLLTRGDDRLEAFTRADGTLLPPVTGYGVRRLRPGPDADLALASESYYVDVIESGGGRPILRRQHMCSREHPIAAVDCARAGTMMCVAACDDGRLEQVVLGGTPSTLVPSIGDEVTALALLPGAGELVIGHRHGGISRVTRPTGTTRWTSHAGVRVRTVQPSPDGRFVALEDERGHFRVLSLATYDVTSPLSTALTSHGLHPTADGLVALGAALTRWRLGASSPVVRSQHGVSAIAVSRDGRLVARGDRDGVDVLATADGSVVRRIDAVGRMVKSIAFRPDSHALALVVTDSADLVVADADTGAREIVHTLGEGLGSGFRRVGWLGDALLATSYASPLVLVVGGAVRVIDPGAEVLDTSFGVSTATLVDVAGGVLRVDARGVVTRLGLVPGAVVIATTGDDAAPLLARGSELVTVLGQALIDLGSPVIDLVATSDAPGRPARWVAGLLSGEVVVIDPRSPGRPLWVFAGHDDRVASIAVASASSSEVWSAGWDGRVRRYALRPEEALTAR